MGLTKLCCLISLVLCTCMPYISASSEINLNQRETHNQGATLDDPSSVTRKRLTTSDPNLLWTDGIVHYVFKDSLPSDKAQSYLDYVFPLYEKYSCIRFLPWNSTVQSNYLRFAVNGGRCESFLGSFRSSGQDIYCCKWQTCIHEVGHALGFVHEHQNPLREEFTRIDFQNVVQGFEGSFTLKQDFMDYDLYDIDSMMHYAFRTFTKNKLKTIALLDEETRPYSSHVNTEAYYYYFYELNQRYGCTDSCSLTCDNGGYVAWLDGKCSCRCPEGLEPSSQCTKLVKAADYSCGGIITLDDTTPEITINSPTIDVNHDTICYWFIKSSENSKILLEFLEFDVRTSNGECTDEVSLRYYKPGLFGAPFCGHNFPKVVQSHDNMIVITYYQTNLGSGSSNWQASLAMVKDEEFCYDISNKGHNYNGLVDHAESYQPCLRWDEVRHCKHNIFNPIDFGSNLEGNFCRNPDGATRPWCYTESDTCQRSYCDACQLGLCRDIFPNCASEISSNSAYCSDDPAATRGCRKSCGLCDNFTPLPTDVRCMKPTIPADANTISLNKKYRVGETVTFTCQSDSLAEGTITCLSNGQWTCLNFVCGKCADGWFSHKNKCYKLFHNKRKLSNTHLDCAAAFPDAKVYTDRDAAVHDFITSTFVSETGICEITWMGMTRDTSTDTYEWTTGSSEITWENWNTAFPSNKRYPCVVMANDCTWKDKNCGYPYKYICEYTLNSATTVCEDQRPDCDEILRTNPDFCARERYSFASVNCPYTCGICGDISQVKCSDEGYSKNAALSTTVLAPGQHIEYTCNEGYNLVTGNLLRACTLTGQLTGSSPQCLGILKYNWPVNTLAIRDRDHVGRAGYTYIGNNEYTTIPKKGKLMRWFFYSKFDGTVALQVWRKVTNTQYTFIGQNVIISTMEDRHRDITIPDDGSRIWVKSGDLIGVYYSGSSPGGIPFDICNSQYFPGVNQFETSTFLSSPGQFNTGTPYSFKQINQNGCRLFSLNALIDSKSHERRSLEWDLREYKTNEN